MIDIDNLANAITSAITNYSESTTNAMKKGIDKTAEKAQEITLSKAPVSSSNRRYKKNNKMVTRRSGKYKKAITLKTAYEDRYEKRNVVFVKPNEHALAHLLENGHALRQGGRAKATPHFKYGSEYVENNLNTNIKKELDKVDV